MSDEWANRLRRAIQREIDCRPELQAATIRAKERFGEMSQEKYIRDDFDGCLGHFIEECGEALAAAGKTLRWGWASVNPELPPHQQETNARWLQREMKDLREALDRLQLCFDEDRLP